MNRERIEVEKNYVLSNLDKAYMMINYPYLKDPPTGWDIQWALDEAGVDGTSLTEIQDQLRRGQSADVPEIRRIFSDWSVLKRLPSNNSQGGQSRGGQARDSRGRGRGRGQGQGQGRGVNNAPSRAVDAGADQANASSERFWGNCAAELPERRVRIQIDDEGDITSGLARGVATTPDVLWAPGSTLWYWFQQPEYRLPPGQITEHRYYRRWYLETAFKEWAQLCKLDFKEGWDPDRSEIRIFFYEQEDAKYQEHFRKPTADEANKRISWSMIGQSSVQTNLYTESGGYSNTSMYLELPPLPWPQGSKTLEQAWGTLLHEVGHVLGLRHEHASPLNQTIIGEPKNPKLHPVDTWTPWDPDSIMLYDNYDLKAPEGRDWLPGESRKTKENLNLSQTDKFWIAVSFRIH